MRMTSLGLVVLVTSACGLDPAPAEEAVPRLSTNRLSTNRLSTNSLNAATLAAIASGNVAVIAADRELMKYVVLCARDEGTSINVNGTGYRGRFGLAPNWPNAPFTSDEEEWVWACLEAHANFFGREVPISVRGAHPKLMYASAKEMLLYPFHEGAFYGNGFRTSKLGQSDKYTCEGEAIMKGQMGGWMTWRMCGRNASQCSFTNVGWCRKVDPHACEYEQKDGGDVNCHATASSKPASSGTKAWRSITVYLQNPPAEQMIDIFVTGGDKEPICKEGQTLVFGLDEQPTCYDPCEGDDLAEWFDEGGKLARVCMHEKGEGFDYGNWEGFKPDEAWSPKE